MNAQTIELLSDSKRFFGEMPQATISSLSLDITQTPLHLKTDLYKMNQLCVLGDGIRELQDVDPAPDEAIKSLYRRSLGLVEEIASRLSDESNRKALGSTLRFLAGEDPQTVFADFGSYNESELFLFCGPLESWYQKTKRRYHSVLIATPNHRLQKVNQQIEHCLPDIVETMRSDFDDELYLKPPSQFQIFDLMMCGGEAAYYPQHFSYFLPENLGIKKAPVKRTVLFLNVYYTRFRLVSERISQRTLVGVDSRKISQTRAEKALTAWFKGHDVSHFFMHPATDYKLLRNISFYNSMVLQEAIADSMGFLVATHEKVKNDLGVTDEDVASCFSAELLRYAVRSMQLFGDQNNSQCFVDTDAAFIELAYLYMNGYLRIESPARLHINTEQLCAGVKSLAGELINLVLKTDLDRAKDFLGRYLERNADNAPVRAFLLELAGGLADVPSYFMYRIVQDTDKPQSINHV